MDGENNGSKPYEQMDDLGVPLFSETPMSTHVNFMKENHHWWVKDDEYESVH